MQKLSPGVRRTERESPRSSAAAWLSLLGRIGLSAQLVLCSSCTLHHSKQALVAGGEAEPAPDATFVQEEDSGVAILGLFQLAEPDHYAVLLERARRRYKCSRIHHAQLDFFTDHWLLVAFPISRITAICDPPRGNEQKAATKP